VANAKGVRVIVVDIIVTGRASSSSTSGNVARG